jgi:putative copper resistance protein D
VLASDYYTSLHRPWGGSPLADQRLGAGIGWAFGEVPTLAVLAVLFLQWVRADERAARAHDRAADRALAQAARTRRATEEATEEATGGAAAGAAVPAEDELSRYNAYLAALHRRSSGTPTSGVPASGTGESGTGGDGDPG